ncbi:pentatricopeptide repeat-containing protein At2g13600 [Cryptomeria japonica]|uniref:pentatricopeptide repeat-containing protein At2g13600 n=1 Tax=Cryptomeria japonica TaxID=3369 RepID=UPI0027DAAFFB|nr:pentatricopeptide repeat-containing protein At2g13600 [Cryptomeria japonica]XP_057865086.2 pentatricopeptide repeat-containing protein At2g13600 [Cryptomeria japonica]XP_057865087.2 pentatricopeptide repeat-containing protein At2g13600 [Cryptomeria japonica]
MRRYTYCLQYTTPLVHSSVYLQLLQTCIAKNALSQGKQAYSVISYRGFAFATVAFFQNKLIDMYAKCGSLLDARQVFDDTKEGDCFSWNAIIAAYRRHGYEQDALTLFQQMQRIGVQPDRFIFSSIIQTCAKTRALEQGIGIHQSVIERGLLSDVVVGSAVVDMYAKCGSILKAREVFDKMPQRNVISWNAMISGYAQNGILNEAWRLFKLMPQKNLASWNAMIAGYAHQGFDEEALETFEHMELAGLEPNSTTFGSILPVCAKLGALEQGMDIHKSIIESGLLSNVVVGSALINMYSECGCIDKACEVFGKMPQRNVVSWTSMLAGYAQNGDLDAALSLFKQMPQRNVVSWTTMMAGYVEKGFNEKALETFLQMQLAGVKPNSTTFASILPACTNMGALEQGMGIHARIVKSRFLTDLVVVSSLIDMYGKCGSIRKASELFDKMPQRNVVSWTAMIMGYAQNGFFEEALETFKQMFLAGVKPNPTTFSSTLPACAKMGALELGKAIHQSVIVSGFLSEVAVVNALIDMYAKSGSIQQACELFDKMSQRDAVSWNVMLAGYAQNGILAKALNIFKEMPQRNVVSWTVMIAGYVQNGFVEEALETYKQMQLAGVKPNSTTFASILPGCAKIGALEQGIDIHQSIIESEFSSDVIVVNALIDMYAKCGSIQKARELFDKMSNRDVISWNTMITGYAQNGFCKDALKLFELMKHCGKFPNHISFASVLFACSHAGFMGEGCKYLKEMSDSYCITPTIDHYVCMVDLFGRAGYLEETLNLIIKMPVKPVVFVWMCLLSACRTHKNIGLGVFASTHLLELDPKKSATYVLLSNMYAEGGRWGEVQKVRRLMKDGGIEKTPGCTWIEVHKTVHAFCVGDRYHLWTQEIGANSEKFSWEMKEEGNFSDCRNFLNDVDKEEKNVFLCHHSEMAIAFGL